MILIEKKYLPSFETEKAKISDELQSNFIDIVPIEILNDLYILPETVLTNPIFKKIFNNFNDYTIREVNQNEFKQITL